MESEIVKPAPVPLEAQPSGSETGKSARPTGKWERYGNVVKRLTRITSIIGMIGLVALILFTVIDVLGSKLFDRPFPGYTGVTELAQLIAMAFAMGIAYLGGHHITIELLKGRIPKRVEFAMYSFVHCLGLGLFILIVWRLIYLGWSYQVSREVVDQIYIPVYPFPYATAVAMIPVVLLLIYNLGNSLRGAINR